MLKTVMVEFVLFAVMLSLAVLKDRNAELGPVLGIEGQVLENDLEGQVLGNDLEG